MRIFITGIGGFIGYHVAKTLHSQGFKVCGLDNFNSYYDPAFKRLRAKNLESIGVQVIDLDLCDSKLKETLLHFNPTHLLHLAAQAGIRYSLQNPFFSTKNFT